MYCKAEFTETLLDLLVNRMLLAALCWVQSWFQRETIKKIFIK